MNDSRSREDSLLALLYMCVKKFGEDGVLRLPDVELDPPYKLSVDIVGKDAIIAMWAGREAEEIEFQDPEKEE